MMRTSILLFILFHLAPLTAAQPDFLYHFCMNGNGNYTNTSTYKENLSKLLSSITSDTQIDYGFYNVSAGQGSDKVNGIALCRGDVTVSTCQSCLNDSSYKITQNCPNQMEAIGWYDDCMLRYSNRSIFGANEESPEFFMWNPNNASDGEQFSETLGDLLSSLQKQASAGDSRRKFATGDANVSSFLRLYALMQCTPDLSLMDCYNCLGNAINQIPSCCNGKQGGRVVAPSCNLRYEIYKFYDSSNDTTNTVGGNGKKSKVVIIVVVIAVISAVFVTLICCCLWRRRTKSWKKVKQLHDATPSEADVQITTAESLQFNFETIRAATDNFAEVKKLGRGGFGAVYKGKLPNGQEIAVKRLARNSGQGDLEFKNEVQIVAKLQHKNLVRLLGFCLEGEERLLIYEFMPNTSLDHFLFDSIKRAQLNWEMRHKIIVGVARGLLYLHEDSRLRIIHRDLKASNILLDANMNAKISDFGMAKLFPIDQTHADTRRIWIYGSGVCIAWVLSVKSDVYSFGVLVLEIVSGQKNCGISSGERIEDLITQVWKDWREGKALNIVDPTMLGGSRSEMMRCIHIGLLCVQENEADRPTMSSVVVMLSSHSLSLPMPLEPAYFLRSGISSATQSQDYSRITEAE